jgi:general secretion pathway protein H
MYSGDDMSAPHRQHGFTLLEMLVVLAILAAVVATAMPAIGHGGTELRGQAYELAAELRGLRAAATRSGAVTEFALDPGTGSYFLGDAKVALRHGVILTYRVGDPPLVGDTIDHLAFYPDGSSSGGTITLEHDGGRMTLTIAPMDGRIAIDG